MRTAHVDDRHEPRRRAAGEFRVFHFAPNGWVPNNGRLPVIVYRHVLPAGADDLADAFEARFTRYGWPVQWRDSVFDYHHFHSTAHEVMGVFAGSAELILGGPGGYELRVSAGDALLLPAGTGHCLASRAGGFQVIAGYPAGQQWDIRREALTPLECHAMDALPFPPTDPLLGDDGPLVEHWHD